MSSVAIVALIMRWAHILSAIVAVGGSIFIRFVLMPAAGQVLDESTHNDLRTAMIKRWQKFVHTCILLFLVSGFYNYLVNTRHEHDGQAIYHMLFGIKFLLALAVFALAVALTSLKNWSAGMRANSKLWLGILIVLAVAVVMISSYMRALPKVTAPATAIQVAAQS